MRSASKTSAMELKTEEGQRFRKKDEGLRRFGRGEKSMKKKKKR